MKPIRPKYSDTVEVQWRISKKSREIILQYSKYTKYDESELVSMIIEQIMDDEDFVNWLKSKRYTKRIGKLILDTFTESEDSEVEVNEVDKESCSV